MTARPEHDLFSKVIENWRPEPDMKLSEWAEKHVFLPSGKLKLFPHQSAMLNAIQDNEHTVLMTSARVGKTMLSSIVGAYYLSARPLRVGYVQPTSDDANGFSAESLMPLLESCEPVAKLLASSSRKTMTHIESAGGSLKLLSASTPRSFRRIDLDVILLDETSAYPLSDEGDVISLAKKRAMNSFARKIVETSTPTGKESAIVKAWSQSNQQWFWVPCPHCGTFQVLEWENICIGQKPVLTFTQKDIRDINENTPDWRATYRCSHCAESIEREKHLSLMLEQGDFRASVPINKIPGFTLSALYSPFPNADWTKLVTDEFFPALRDPMSMRTFENTILGIPYEDTVSDLDTAALMERCNGNYSADNLPEDVLALFAGVDVQGDRLELILIGQNDREQFYMVEHKVFRGSPAESAVWKLLDQYLDTEFQHELGGCLRILGCAIDSGYLTEHVSKFAETRHDCYAVKGRAGGYRVMELSRQKMHKDGGKLHLVGVDTIKESLFLNLAQTDSQQGGFWHFPEHLKGNEEFFDQLASEHKILTVVGGRPVAKWQRKTGRQAEVLDGTVYAIAMSTQFSPDWEKTKKDVTVHPSDDLNKNGFDPLDWGAIGVSLGNKCGAF